MVTERTNVKPKRKANQAIDLRRSSRSDVAPLLRNTVSSTLLVNATIIMSICNNISLQCNLAR